MALELSLVNAVYPKEYLNCIHLFRVESMFMYLYQHVILWRTCGIFRYNAHLLAMGIESVSSPSLCSSGTGVSIISIHRCSSLGIIEFDI